MTYIDLIKGDIEINGQNRLSADMSPMTHLEWTLNGEKFQKSKSPFG